jgi:hypothetical protein
VRWLSRNVRHSAGEAWVTEPDSTSAAAGSKTVRHAKAATAAKTTGAEAAATAKVSATAATETAAAMTTTAAAAAAVGTCPPGVD